MYGIFNIWGLVFEMVNSLEMYIIYCVVLVVVLACRLRFDMVRLPTFETFDGFKSTCNVDSSNLIKIRNWQCKTGKRLIQCVLNSCAMCASTKIESGCKPSRGKSSLSILFVGISAIIKVVANGVQTGNFTRQWQRTCRKLRIGQFGHYAKTFMRIYKSPLCFRIYFSHFYSCICDVMVPLCTFVNRYDLIEYASRVPNSDVC
jgi:hypothetical protein